MTTENKGLVERLGWHREHPVTGKMVLINPDGPEAATRIRELEAERDAVLRNIPMDYLQRHDAAGATGPTSALNLAAAMKAYAEDRWKIIDRLSAAEAQCRKLEEALLDCVSLLTGELSGSAQTAAVIAAARALLDGENNG